MVGTWNSIGANIFWSFWRLCLWNHGNNLSTDLIYRCGNSTAKNIQLQKVTKNNLKIASIIFFQGTEYDKLYICEDAAKAGIRPFIPSEMDSHWKQIMTACWHQNPSQRPMFNEILIYLSEKNQAVVPSTTFLKQVKVRSYK